jgi:ElaB/YqjD/DUF883 family membrane-anchored ribosome-binding protein
MDDRESATGTAQRLEPTRGEPAIDTWKNKLAEKLQSAAITVQDKARAANEDSPISTYGEKASRWLNNSADYLNKKDFEQMKTDVREQIRRNPGRSLLIAGAAGLILGTILRRR